MNTNQIHKSHDCNYTGKTYQQEYLHLKQRSRFLYIKWVTNAPVRCYRNSSDNHQHQLTVIWGEKEAGKKKGKDKRKKNPTTTGHQSIMNPCPLLQPEKHMNG